MAKMMLEARPQPITLDTKKTVVLVVDMQNDFGSKGGLLDNGGVDIRPIQAVVSATARAIGAARQAGIKVIYLKMVFRDYQCVLLRDSMAEPIGNDLPRSNHEASLLAIEVGFGWTASSEDFVRGLRAGAV